MKKILIIHDRFQFRGGAERMVLDMAQMLQADIVTEFWTDESFSKTEAPAAVTVLDQGEPAMMVFRYFRAQWNFWWKTRNLIKNYDTIIFSGNNCLAAALRPLQDKRTIFYCHSPVRYVYDLLAHRRSNEPSWAKRFFYYDLGKYLIRGLFQLGLSRMQVTLTNSYNVKDRIKRYCGIDAKVLYPPIHTERFHWIKQEPYYLSWGRLDSLKRIDDIIRAFQRMPDKRLVIASGGPELEVLQQLASGFPNIEILGWVESSQLETLVGNCIATIYIPIDEDFGMTPVESMSAGKPCIGVFEGGLKESITHQVNGLLIPKRYELNDLVSAIETLTPERALQMKQACIDTAKRFSLEMFENELRRYL